MEIKYTVDDLINFEKDIAECFNNKMIRAPIHLEDGNIPKLIEVFKDVNEDDWVLGTWRSHMKNLLKGVPPDQLKKAILEGKSISLCFKEYRTLSSAIVTGNIPIGLGLAMDIKRKGQNNRVWVFVGEMTGMSGIFHEAYVYAKNHELPITFVVEDNSKSVLTDTRKVWNSNRLYYEPWDVNVGHTGIFKSKHLYYFKYELGYPHSGAGTRIQF